MDFNASNPPLQTSVFYNVTSCKTFTEDGLKNSQVCTSTKRFNVIIELERCNVRDDDADSLTCDAVWNHKSHYSFI